MILLDKLDTMFSSSSSEYLKIQNRDLLIRLSKSVQSYHCKYKRIVSAKKKYISLFSETAGN